ncbi:MAG: hypothetical protein QF521_18960 [Alphaproteobacteria bacterium]|nr:hypothetical protein [Alphaproteobacteria bacterium]
MNDLGPMVDAFGALASWQQPCPKDSVGNFLGVMTDREFLARHYPSNTNPDGFEGDAATRLPRVEDGEPFFEFAAIYNAVKTARERFIMVELGGGYAARSVDAHRLLQKLNPMPSQLTIVEAEPTHFEWAKQHLIANGIDPSEHWLINAAVCADSEPRLFMLGSGLYYNGIVRRDDIERTVRDIVDMDGTAQALRNLMLGGRCGMQRAYDSAAGTDVFDYKFVSSLPLADILAPLPHVDLIDMDIQGAEDSVLPPAMEMLDRRVRRIHIGTHRADIHGGLWDLFFEHEWICDFDYPPFSKHNTPWGEFETMDGILHFHNPRL